ncbi:MAG: 50S ribosomal protein L24 [Candidatus Zixiibacteriota bacterium]
MHIRKNDTVYVLTGQDKGKTGRVLFVNADKGTLLVEGISRRKRHQRPTQRNPKGGIITKETPIHISNVALYSPSLGGPTKVSTKVIDEGGKKQRVRICRKTGEQL